MIVIAGIIIGSVLIGVSIGIAAAFHKFAQAAKNRSLVGILTPENLKTFAFNAGKDYISLEMNKMITSGYMQYCTENECDWIDEFMKNENDGRDIEKDIEFITCDINLPNDICKPEQSERKRELINQFKLGIESML